MSERKKILFVSYPLLPVSEESAGGAEQMLCTLERELHRRGHRTVTAAAAGSCVSGELLVTGSPARHRDALEERRNEQNHWVLDYLRRHEVDLVHDQGGTFWTWAAGTDVPVLATLHLPRHFYPQHVFENCARNLAFNCVSHSQAGRFADVAQMAGRVLNGIALERFPFAANKGEYLLWVGRICHEKGPHLALEVARRAKLPVVIAGQVYPLTYHLQFFEKDLKPLLAAMGAQAKWIEAPTHAQKLALLRNARAVLVPSLEEETSSLVAMEAMACGTPVVAFRRGALPEVIVDGETGLLADDLDGMVTAVERARSIRPLACREHVLRHHSADRMAADYEALYERVLERLAVREAA